MFFEQLKCTFVASVLLLSFPFCFLCVLLKSTLEAYSELCQAFKIECFAKQFIFDVWMDFHYASAVGNCDFELWTFFGFQSKFTS